LATISAWFLCSVAISDPITYKYTSPLTQFTDAVIIITIMLKVIGIISTFGTGLIAGKVTAVYGRGVAYRPYNGAVFAAHCRLKASKRR